MTFVDLVAQDQVFVDANTLTYYFQPHPIFGPACHRLMQRIENRELSGFTSTHVVSEAAHRVMTLEAIDRFGWPFAGIGNRLRQHPAEVQKLSAFQQAVDEIVHSQLQLLLVTGSMLASAAALCQQIGLLTNDALVVAVMQAHGLTKLASRDADFDRVPGLFRYAPA